MEFYCSISEQHQLTERQYTDKSGQSKIFASMGFVLNAGIDTFYAELTGDRARSCGTLDQSRLYKASVSSRARCYQNEQGRNIWVNDFYIDKLQAIG